MLLLTGDRDSLQLVTEHSTVLYPMRGVSDLARMTPEAVEDEVRRPAATATPSSPPSSARTPTTCPACPGSGPKTAAKWISEYDGLDNVIAHADKIKGKAGDNLREHLGDVIRNRQLNALVCDLRPRRAPRPTWPSSRGTASEVHQLFDGLEFRVLRDRLFATLESEEEVEEVDFDLDLTRLAPGELAGWLRQHAAPASGSACRCRAPGEPGTGDVYALALATGDEAAAWLDVEQITPEDDAALADWLADAGYQQGAARRQGPDAGAGRPRLDAAPAWSATPRCRRTSPAPTSAPTTWPTSPCATSSAS